MNLIFTGDFCPIYAAEKYVLSGGPKDLFGNLLEELLSVDACVTNLECPLTSSERKIVKTGPHLKASPEVASFMAEANLRIALLANNHIMDYAEQGLSQTMLSLKKHAIWYAGAGENLASAAKPLYVELQGKCLAFLNICEHEYSIASVTSHGANPIELFSNTTAFFEAKKKADYVFVIVHGGHEYLNFPSPYYRNLLRYFADLGADAVFGHHTHYCSGFEIRNEVPIFYSLGNFVFPWNDKKEENWWQSYLVKLDIDKHIAFSIIPFKQDPVSGKLTKIEGDDLSTFTDYIDGINSLISNESIYTERWEEFVLKHKTEVLAGIKRPNRIALILARRGLLPMKRVISKKDILFYYHTLHCESRAELVRNVLEKEKCSGELSYSIHHDFLSKNS